MVGKAEQEKSVPIAGNWRYTEINAPHAVLNIKKVKMVGDEIMTEDQQAKCHAIIHSASVAAGGVGAGLAQIPGSDNAVITPIQLTMTISLGKVFGVSLSEASAKAAMGSLAASTVGRTISQVLVGWIPGVGNAINATTAAGITEALGWALAKEFDEGILS